MQNFFYNIKRREQMWSEVCKHKALNCGNYDSGVLGFDNHNYQTPLHQFNIWEQG